MYDFVEIPAYEQVSRQQFFEEIVPRQQPVVLRGAIKHWPLVDAAQRSPAEFAAYLRKFYHGNPVRILFGHPAIKGRYFYTDDMQGLNYISGEEKLDRFLDRLLELTDNTDPPSISIQGASVDTLLPGLADENPMPLFEKSILPKLWLGNKVTVSAHYDGSDNLACVVAGRRQFVLFPPDQVANLYPGPLDFTPAGTPVSLVSLHHPDFERYPRYRDALKNAQTARLMPGDAIFIPMLWWHHVDSLAPVNGLMNYWWNGSIGNPHIKPTPLESLNFAALAMRDLSPAQRNAWKAMFDHYLFRQEVDPLDYIPAHRHGILGEISPDMERQIKKWFIEQLQK